MGLRHVICLGGVDPYNPKVVQSTAGVIGLPQLRCVSTWQHVLDMVGSHTLVGLVPEGGEPATPTSLGQHCLVVGNEATGMKKEWAADCHHLVSLAMPGVGAQPGALNAAVAGSIAMYVGYGLSAHVPDPHKQKALRRLRSHAKADT